MKEHEITILDQLIGLSRRLGEPARDLVILGDGNTSARIDEDSFWIKASGATLDQISEDGFTRVRLQPILKMLEMGDLSDQQIHQELFEAKADPGGRHPSIETLLHGLAYALCGASFVGHTHPVALNSILCSREARQVLNGHIFTETAVYIGRRPLILDYADPGLPLARELKKEILAFLEQNGEPPRVFYLLNHGLVALGKTAQEVENITAMLVKSARILLGTYALGGPNFLTEAQVDRIIVRPDEKDRRNLANRK